MNIINFNKEIINKIQTYQEKSGRFKVSVIDNDSNVLGNSPSIFSTSVILGNLSVINNINDYHFLKKASEFLVKQGLVNYSWNYWDRNSYNYKKISYPDDLDDSALAIFAILNYANIDNYSKSLSKSIRKIESKKNKKLGYKTWFVPENANKHWLDFDPVVNSNVILLRNYLGLETDLKIIKSLYSGLEKNSLQSKYYFNKNHIAYFIIRMRPNYTNETVKKELIKNLSLTNDILTLSMILSSLVRLNCEEKILTQIYNTVVSRRDDWNKIYPLHIESIKGNTIYYAGSEALTLSFVLEALNLYENHVNEFLKQDEINNKLIRISLKGTNFDKEVYSLLNASMQYILSWKSVRRIILLPLEIQKINNKSNSLTNKILAIGLLGWVAYTIDDHLKDGDKEIKTKWVTISISNILKNRMYQLITEVSDHNTKAVIYEIITKMETYSALEEAGKHLDYGKMEHSMKSLGIAIPSILLFANNKKSNIILNSFKYYISARQISDDATDWKEDLKAGKLTYVTEKFQRKQNRRSFEKLFFPKITNKIAGECRKSIELSLEIFPDIRNPLANINYEYIRATRRELAQKILSKR